MGKEEKSKKGEKRKKKIAELAEQRHVKADEIGRSRKEKDDIYYQGMEEIGGLFLMREGVREDIASSTSRNGLILNGCQVVVWEIDQRLKIGRMNE